MGSLVFDEHGTASLDGRWDFHPGDHALSELGSMQPESIDVPRLWEAQGRLALDGVAWYRRTFAVDDLAGFWTLRFGAVMDIADVFLNGQALGTHDSPFTPFELDATQVLRAGPNELAVKVTDPAVGDPEHARLPHGKQGWANHVFPSPPSLYMTYGGIWQPVSLRRHGPVVVADAFVNGDADDLVVAVEVENRSASPRRVRVGVHAVGAAVDVEARLEPGETAIVEVSLGATPAARWTPSCPVLHECLVEARTDGVVSDARAVRFGLRRVRVDGTRLVVEGEPYRMKSALVQGFRAGELYAEGDRGAIEEEVRAALAMGFNTLRLHIKAFDPAYLDVCDELGMLLHCDIPVAEPIAHEELGGDTALARRCVRAATEQVRRDRNHPSVILWSAMNEVGVDRIEARDWPGYADFARTMVAAVTAADPTRPVIENDWVEPDPGRVHAARILTAHWYGRLHADYLDKIEASCTEWDGVGRPLFVTEFGDWGLPDMPLLAEPPFWDTRAGYAAGLTAASWPATVARFVVETQRYQGLSDRLQAEVFRRHDSIGGYCLTELTDVPAELNGLLDLHRRPKPMAVAEMARANQVVLPMLHLDSLVVVAGDLVRAPVHVANDGPPLADVVVECRFGDAEPTQSVEELGRVDASVLPAERVMARFNESMSAVRVGDVPGWRAAGVGTAALVAPEATGSHDLVVTLRSGGRTVAANRYPIHVVAAPHAPLAVRAVGDRTLADALSAVGARVGSEGPTFVAEGALDDPAAAAGVRARLSAGDTVVVLAQRPEAAGRFPLPVSLEPVETAWGSTVFHFTTTSGALPSLPRRALLVAEDSTIAATTVVSGIDGRTFPDLPVVIAYKPVPGALTATVVGSHQVGAGRLVLCQYRLTRRAVAGDAAARALLADLVRWAADPRGVMGAEVHTKDDGRSLTYYSFPPGWDR
ncbi:MAG TPA: glycoside hydrolase family 2 TIM barrel-domain containing protein [Acidimicrobiales bacterium]|nr:glycoside hydrolase family 2 TIM barrel-domain containing protein [Acidimicrobiales bacterium]